MLTKRCLAVMVFVVVGVVGMCDYAMAVSHAFDIDAVSVDTTPVFTIAVIIITGLAAIWAVHKTISLIRAR